MDHDQQQDQEIEQGSDEEKTRTRAYYLWEQATDPKGTPDEYWEQARAEIAKKSSDRDSVGNGADKSMDKEALSAPEAAPKRKH
jgi:hypothetical protein